MTEAVKTKLVFLGGTAGKNPWRDGFIDACVARGIPREALFNPVVADWNEEARAREEEAKRTADVQLFYLTDPQDGVNAVSAYSLVEATIALYDVPDPIIVFDATGMTGHAAKVMRQVEHVLRTRFPNADMFTSMDAAVEKLVETLAVSQA